MLLRGWEQFDDPVDRIISLEAIEAFPQERYAPFFKACRSVLPSGGRMLIQAILGHPLKRWPEMGIPIMMTDLRFMRFIAKEIFPGGSVPVRRRHHRLVRRGRLLARTEAAARRALRADAGHVGRGPGGPHDEAVAATSEEVYQRYMKYLVGCSDFFKRGISELGQFTLVKA